MFKKLCILAIICISANAYALAPSTVPDIEIYLAGSSAQDDNIQALFNQLCTAGTLDIFLDDSAKPGSAYRAYFCTLDNAQVPGLSVTNPNALMYKRSKGGSAQGVNPLIDSTPIDFMAINNGNCTQVGTTNVWNCTTNNTGDLVQQPPTAGVSDVNPELFFSINTPAGETPVDFRTVASRLQVTSAAALLFGIPVNLSFYQALQEVQKNAGRLPASCNLGDYTEACMPSLSTNQLASIFFGVVNHWNQLTAKNAGGNVMKFVDAVSSAPKPSNKRVAICRRVPGSGTQATTSAKFLHRPCSGFALNPATEFPSPGAISSNVVTGPIVVENSGSGDVENCLADFENGTNNTGKNPTSDTFWAIGLQGTEKNADASEPYRFVKVDGVAPTLKNAFFGRYKNWVEQSYQWQKPGQPNPPSADQLAILNVVAKNAAGPFILGPLNQSQYNHPFGVAGYLALSINGHQLTADGVWDPNNPVTPYTHFPPGFNTLSDCRVPVFDRFATDTNGAHMLPFAVD